MSSPIRLKDSIIKEAEAEARIFSRSVPKQIEFWAEIGKSISHSITQDELMALLNGIAKIRIETIQFDPIDPEKIFTEVERASKNGNLTNSINSGSFYYEASQSNAGCLDRVEEDGSRMTGYFRNGKFQKNV